MKRIYLLLIICLVSSNIYAQSNLFLNPSLETWTNGATPNETPDSWLNCSVSGIGVDCVPLSCNALPAIGSNGINYARAVAGEGFSQSITTNIGSSYTIKFDYCGVSNCFGSQSNSSWDVDVNSVSILTTPDNAGTNWVTDSITFVASSVSTTICFKRNNSVIGQGGIDNLVVYPEIALGVIGNEFGNNFLIYPNPTDGDFSIDLGDNHKVVTITLTDLVGKIILSNTYNDSQLLNFNIEEPAGVYLLIIESEDKKEAIRLVKE